MRSLAFAAAAALTTTSFAFSAAAQYQSTERPDPAVHGSQDDLQRELQNPISSVVSLPFQDNWGFGVDPDDRENNVLLIQPVAPIPLTPDWNYIVRPIIPVLSEPIPTNPPSRINGLGDIDLETFFSPSHPGKFIWGLGPNVVFPSGTNGLSQRQWGLGPSFVGLVQPKPWTLGILVSQVWGVGERPANVPYLNQMSFEPFAALSLGHGWTMNYASPWAVDWSAHGEQWTIPVGFAINKLTRPKGFLPVQYTFGAFDNVVRGAGQPRWFLRFQVQLVLPRPWKKPWFGAS
jgi:hypothetical protein